MKAALILLNLAVFAAVPAGTASLGFAQDVRVEPVGKSASLSGVPKAMIQRAALQASPLQDFSSLHAQAQFVRLEPLGLPVQLNGKLPPNACGYDTSSLCYDYRTGSAVYKPMAALLPTIPGLTPQNLSIRHSTIVVSYTFK